MLDKDLERFWSKVRKGEGDSCWVWTASCFTGMGYGQFSLDGGRVRLAAHRAIFEHHSGRKLGKLEWVLHRCDNPPCVRMDHLFLGTPRDNALDMHAKGRARIASGERQGQSKLTNDAVLDIRANYTMVPLEFFAKKYGVSKPTITYMLKGKTWSHLGPVPGWTGRKPRTPKAAMEALRAG
jgi:hypothetical protein